MLDDIVSAYIRKNPRDVPHLGQLIEHVANGKQPMSRKNLDGHIVASGIVLSEDRSKILLISHKFLGRWLQPGGHIEPTDTDSLAAARREVAEETAVTELEYLPVDADNPLVPFMIDTHLIPDRPEKEEPAHWHHDFRYVFIADEQDLTPQAAEVHGAGWFSFDAPECQDGVQQIISKLRSSGIID